MVWKELKKYITNSLYKEVDDMTDAMDDMIKTGTVILPSLPVYALDAITQARVSTTTATATATTTVS